MNLSGIRRSLKKNHIVLLIITLNGILFKMVEMFEK